MSRLNHRERADHFKQILAPHFGPDMRRSVIQLVTTVVPFLLFWYAAYRSLEVGYWLTLIVALKSPSTRRNGAVASSRWSPTRKYSSIGRSFTINGPCFVKRRTRATDVLRRPFA